MDHVHLLQQEKVEHVFVHYRHHKFGERGILRDEEPTLGIAPSGKDIPNRLVIRALLDASFEDAKRDLKSAGAKCEATITVACDVLYERIACNSKLLSNLKEAPNPDESVVWEETPAESEAVRAALRDSEVAPPVTHAADPVHLQMPLARDTEHAIAREIIAPNVGSAKFDGETLGEAVAPGVSSSVAQAGTPLTRDALDAELDAAASEEEQSETLLLHLHVRAEVNIQVDDQADTAGEDSANGILAANSTQGCYPRRSASCTPAEKQREFLC